MWANPTTQPTSTDKRNLRAARLALENTAMSDTTKKQTVTLWIGTQPEPEDRTQIEVSASDAERIPPRGSLSEPVTVTDLKTGKAVTVRSAACSLGGCVCALEFVSNT